MVKKWMARCGFLLSLVTAMPITAQDVFSTQENVGRGENGRVVTPVNQVVTPTGRLIELAGSRPQAIALSPQGQILVTSGKTHELVVIDPDEGKVIERVLFPGEKILPQKDEPSAETKEYDRGAQISYTGMVFSEDATRLYVSNVEGSIKVFSVEGTKVRPLHTLPLPEATAPNRKNEIPAGLALSPDGKRLWVCANLSNRLLAIDTATGTVTHQWDVGVAPYEVVVLDGTAFVSNWGGRRPEDGSLTGPAGQGTRVRVDPVRHVAAEGTVSIIDLSKNRVEAEIAVGLHPSAMALSPDKKTLAVTNSGSDTVSLVDTVRRSVRQTVWTKENASSLFGAMPIALTFDPSGEHLFVCNGGMNGVAVIELEEQGAEWEGIIPVGWFPGSVVFDARRKMLSVANIKGHSPGRPNADTKRMEFNSHLYHGSVSLVPIPTQEELASLTAQVLANNRAPTIRASLLPARPGRARVPVPERTGEPSVFEHVIYIIKENRTYDQVFGDDPRGNGDASLCIFGEEVTPNQHKMVKEFVLLDNTYCSGILSADGHQWADAGLVTAHLEKSFASFPRSYPDGMSDEDVDALLYSPAGFLWDHAVAHQKSLRVYGEFAITETAWKDTANKKPLRFLDYYRDFVGKTGSIEIKSRPAIESLRPYLCMNTVGWDMAIPDVFRAAQFIDELKEYEAKKTLPNLIIICLPNDHTSGTSPGSPTPAAQVADNDLAFGQIVEALSHSSFWKKTCIFAIEDDPQAGWDHVSGYRTTAYVISPYTKRGETVSVQYNQTSLLRTMELMLGLPPMNLFVASATPLTECFTNQMNAEPFTAVPNRVPLDQMNPEPAAIADPRMKEWALASARLPLDEIDRCPEDLLNRILWHSQRGPDAPYPAWAVTEEQEEEERRNPTD